MGEAALAAGRVLAKKATAAATLRAYTADCTESGPAVCGAINTLQSLITGRWPMPQFIETDENRRADLPSGLDRAAYFDLADALAAQRIQRVEQRQKLSLALEQIALEVTVALADLGLEIPVFFTVPSTGEAFVTFMTPADPTDADWSRACDVICGIVGSKVGIENLYSRHLPCVGAGTAAGQ